MISSLQTTEGGGWTIFQRRLDGSVDFFRGWKDYKEGFGTAGGEYWLGLDNIHRLTNQARTLLRVELSGRMLRSAFAEYRDFVVSSEGRNYTLGLGSYTGWYAWLARIPCLVAFFIVDCICPFLTCTRIFGQSHNSLP